MHHTPMNDLGESIPPLGTRRYERRSSHATPPRAPGPEKKTTLTRLTSIARDPAKGKSLYKQSKNKEIPSEEKAESPDNNKKTPTATVKQILANADFKVSSE